MEEVTSKVKREVEITKSDHQISALKKRQEAITSSFDPESYDAEVQKMRNDIKKQMGELKDLEHERAREAGASARKKELEAE